MKLYPKMSWLKLSAMLLLAVLFFLFAAMLEVVTLLPLEGSTWLSSLPVGALAMLTTILFDPPIGVLMTIPITALVAFAAPGEPGAAVFAWFDSWAEAGSATMPAAMINAIGKRICFPLLFERCRVIAVLSVLPTQSEKPQQPKQADPVPVERVVHSSETFLGLGPNPSFPLARLRLCGRSSSAINDAATWILAPVLTHSKCGFRSWEWPYLMKNSRSSRRGSSPS